MISVFNSLEQLPLTKLDSIKSPALILPQASVLPNFHHFSLLLHKTTNENKNPNIDLPQALDACQ
jgi:hypothetical protein